MTTMNVNDNTGLLPATTILGQDAFSPSKPSTPLLPAQVLTLLGYPYSLSNGGTGDDLTSKSADGGLIYSNAATVDVLPPGVNDTILMSGAPGSPIKYSTLKYPTALPATVPSTSGNFIFDGTNIVTSYGLLGSSSTNNIIVCPLSTLTMGAAAGSAFRVFGFLSNGDIGGVNLTSTNHIGIGTTTGIGAAFPTATSPLTYNSATFNFAAAMQGLTTAGTTQTMTVNRNYVATNAALSTFTLPAVAPVGTSIQVSGQGAGGWRIAQNAGQVIRLNTASTTVGTGGSVSSATQYASITLRCTVANTEFVQIAGLISSGYTIV